MYNFQYVTRAEIKPIKKQLIEIFNKVQDKVREYFTFQYYFIGSEKLNMITWDVDSNIGFDFDVNFIINDDSEEYGPEEIKTILMNSFNFVLRRYGYSYDNCENSTRVITIKVKDHERSKILHSCDIAIINEYYKGQQYIRFNKKGNYYSWEDEGKGFYTLNDKINWLKNNNLWLNVREEYLYKKNNNVGLIKKSRSLRAETINEIYTQYLA